MKMRAILGALVLASLSAMPALAENMTPEDIKKLVDEAVEQRLQERERREGALNGERVTTSPGEEPGVGSLPEVGRERRTESSRPSPSDQQDPAVWYMPSRSFPPQSNCRRLHGYSIPVPSTKASWKPEGLAAGRRMDSTSNDSSPSSMPILLST